MLVVVVENNYGEIELALARAASNLLHSARVHSSSQFVSEALAAAAAVAVAVADGKKVSAQSRRGRSDNDKLLPRLLACQRRRRRSPIRVDAHRKHRRRQSASTPRSLQGRAFRGCCSGD